MSVFLLSTKFHSLVHSLTSKIFVTFQSYLYINVLTSQTWTFHFFIVVLVIGDYFIGLETLYLAKQVGMINGKFAFIIFHLNHNFIRKATSPGLRFLWFFNYLNAKYRQVTSARGGGRREVLLISSDEDARMGAKIKTPQNSQDFQQNLRM